MRIFLTVIVLFSLIMAADRSHAENPSSLALMPMPASVQVQAGRLNLDASFSIAVTGYSDARLEAAIERLQKRIAGRTGITLVPGLTKDAGVARLVIGCQAAGEHYPKLGEDESYTLEVTGDRATLTAPNVLGAMRGMETVLQLVSADNGAYFFPAVSIRDQPRFAWRGLMVDVGRHFQPVEVVKRNIDGLAAVKMNVFHWHLTDDQGFRIESRKYPKLQGVGSDGQYYTQEQVREVIDYAAERGVRVVPEFDMPGHTTSWFVGYPELASAPGPYQIERKFGIFDPTMDPTREETYQFLDVFLGEMAELFPDQFIHIGGDENNGKQWKANPKVQQFMQEHGHATTAALQTYFSQRVLKIVQKHGKRVVGWDEILTPELPKDAVVQGWHGTKSLADAAKQGHLAMWSTAYYLDHMGPAEFLYLADPVPANTTLTADEAKRILGGEVCAWGEYLSPEIIDSRVWPRTAAVAERFWSARDLRDVADMYRRLDVVSIGLQQDGLTHESSTAELLRQASGTRELGPLGILGAVAAPEGAAVRQEIRPGTVFDPLVHVTDAAVPDPPFRRRFVALVDEYLGDVPNFSKGRTELGQVFASWQTMPRPFSTMEAKAPILSDSASRVGTLSALGATGLEAMSYLQTGNAAPAEWRDKAIALVNQAEKPDQSILKLTWMGSYRALMLAAAQADLVKRSDPQQWKQKVLSDAASQEPQEKYTW